MKRLGVLLVLGLEVLAAQLFPQSFSCTGERDGDLCWLSDPRYLAAATWYFPGVTPGDWLLILEGIAIDPCADCTPGRDVLVQVFWRSSLLESWSWKFLTLENLTPEVGPRGYRVGGELSLRPWGGELWVLVRRFALCDPWVGFGLGSARLWAPEPVPVRPPPPPEIPITPPPPTPPLEERYCLVGPLWSCRPALPAEECLPPGLDLARVVRTTLPETMGPGEATTLTPGHYRGTMAEDDWQDWYRFSAAKGEAILVYFEPEGNLVVDVYLVHDPCGTDLAVCLEVRGPVTLEVPCAENIQCVTLPDQELTECFTGPRCGLFVRIVHRSGAGSYKLSLLPARPKPL